jgi:ferredoxin
MKIGDKRVLVCDCERTMTFDVKRLAAALGAEAPVLHTHLCRTQIDGFREAGGGEPLLVCCTQEAPLFEEVAAEVGSAETAAETSYVNIREHAGWAVQGNRAEAKIAALIAEAALDIAPTPAVSLKSDGVVLVYGGGEATLEAARRLAGRLNVTCLLKDPGDLLPPRVMDVPVFRGVVRKASGYLGAFELTIDGFAASSPSSRAALTFEDGVDGAVSTCDVILDLSGEAPLFPAPDKRDGYFRAEPSSPVQVQRVLFDIADMVGEFEKPRYLRVDPAICAHSRNGVVGCDLCLNVCPTAAIVAEGDHVHVDPHICSGHGSCASVCPTGAIVFDLPGGHAVFERLRVLTGTYREAGGEGMVLLVHDARHGEDVISAMARGGRGLPAHVVPFAVNEITQIGLDFLLTALAYGVAQVRFVAAPEHRDTLETLRRHAELIDTVMAGLGYEGGRTVIDAEPDPAVVEETLYREPPSPLPTAARHRVLGEKRSTLTTALGHLHANAPAPVELLALPQGAPFGNIELNLERCTLCLSCVGVCPTAALGDNPDKPQLGFAEVNCVQCGLCRVTCPEDAITLVPRLNFSEAAGRKRVLKEEEPFECVRCGKPFATKSTIETLVGRLAGHSMFSGPGRLEILKMCEDCRVIAQFDDPDAPFAAAPRRVPRTTDDYLREGNRSNGGGRTDDDKS